jgi:hypothetical protein
VDGGGVSRPASLREIADATCRDGLAAGLTAAFEHGEPLPCSLRGRTLLPSAVLPAVTAWATAGGVLPAADCRVEIKPHAVAESEHLALVQVIPPVTTTDPGPIRSTWPRKLLAVRTGLDRRLLALAIDHLSNRTFDGAPLTERQLVRAEIAEIAIVLENVETTFDAAYTGLETAIWHTDVDRADRALERLFGAAGYLDDHPARALRLLALIQDVYAPPGSSLRSAA